MQDKRQPKYNPYGKKESVVKKSYDSGKMTMVHNEDLDTAFTDLKPNAFKLLVYYYSKSDGWVFDNKAIADVFCIKERTVRDLTKELEAEGYLLQQKGKQEDVSLYFVGKKLVRAYSATSDQG